MPTPQSYQDFAATLTGNAALNGMSLDISRTFNEYMENVIDLLAPAHGEALGQMAQTAVVTKQFIAGQLSLVEAKQAYTKIVSAGLWNESLAEERIKRWMKIDHANFASLDKDKMTLRYLLKHVGSASVGAIAFSTASASVIDMLMLSRLQSGGWTDFINIHDVSLGDAVTYLESVIPSGMTISDCCGLWPAGPFSSGLVITVATNTTTTTTTTTTTANQPTVVIQSATTTKGVTNMTNTTASTSALSSLNAAFKPIIDNMFQQSGLKLSVDELAVELSKINALQDERDMYKLDATKAESEIDNLRCALAAAKSAMPATINIANNSTTIPDGSMEMRQVGAIWPSLLGVNLEVPFFNWNHAHPDVPAINDGYIFRKEMLIKALRCLKNNENFWLQGHTGSGKTTFIEQIAARLGWPVARIAFDSNIDRTELVGRMSLKGDGKGGTESSWLSGVLEKASVMGYILLTDEIDAGHPNSLYTLQPMLEAKALNLLEDGGRIVPINPMFRIVATGNTCGNGDSSGLYPACRILSAATLDRFATFIHVPYMTTAEEINLINTMVPGLKQTLVEKMAKFGTEMRKAFTTNQTPISYSPRRSIAFAREVLDLQSMGFKDEGQVLTAAFRSKLYDAASEEFRQRLTEIANASFGGIDPTKSLA